MKHRPWTSGDGIAFVAEHNELYKDWLDAHARIAELEAELADRDARPVQPAPEPRPVKVRFDVTPDEIEAEFSKSEGVIDSWQNVMDYLAAHAVIDAPAALPSDDAVAEALHEAYEDSLPELYPTCPWYKLSSDSEQRNGRIAQARAAKEMLAPWLRPQTPEPECSMCLEKDREIQCLRADIAAHADAEKSLLSALNRADAELEDMTAKYKRRDDDYLKCHQEMQRQGTRALELECELVRISARPCPTCERVRNALLSTPIADAQTIEELARIGREAYYPRPYVTWGDLEEEGKERYRCQTIAILRAAKPYVDAIPSQLSTECRNFQGGAHDSWQRILSFCNSRIRYTVDVPAATPDDTFRPLSGFEALFEEVKAEEQCDADTPADHEVGRPEVDAHQIALASLRNRAVAIDERDAVIRNAMLAPSVRPRHIDAAELDRLAEIGWNGYCVRVGGWNELSSCVKTCNIDQARAVLKALGFTVDGETHG